MRIGIGSAGRRVYLVDWFAEAAKELQLDLEIYVLENDPYAPTVAAATGAHRMPVYESRTFRTELLNTLSGLEVDLYFALNDYELNILADGLADELRAAGITTLSLGFERQQWVADKLRMHAELSVRGIPVPLTVDLGDTRQVSKLAQEHDRLVVKDRYGSGSSGLTTVEARHAVDRSHELAETTAASQYVVQAVLEGIEYGVDIVCPLRGGAPAATLARRKLGMRGGETSAALSVDPRPFSELAQAVAAALSPQGIIDMDVFVDNAGQQHVIDINPRFGGGYPFSHVAGARVPHFYLAQLAGLPAAPDSWLNPATAVQAAKYDAVLRLDNQTNWI